MTTAGAPTVPEQGDLSGTDVVMEEVGPTV